MRQFAISFFLFGLVLLGALGVSAAEAEGRLTGTWRLDASNAESSQRRAAIETSTQEFPSFARSRVRERLEKRTTPPPEVRIAVAGDQVELCGHEQTLRLTIGGPAVPVESKGSHGSARASRRNGILVITMEGDDGVRTTTYRLSNDGQHLVLDVEYRMQRLTKPLRFGAKYQRSSGAAHGERVIFPLPP